MLHFGNSEMLHFQPFLLYYNLKYKPKWKTIFYAKHFFKFNNFKTILNQDTHQN